MKKLASFLLFALGLAGCESTVTLPEPAHTPRIALLYTLSDQALDTSNVLSVTRQPFVSYSKRLFDTRDLAGRDDARIEIQDATGAVVERFKAGYPRKLDYYYPSSGYYTPTMGLVGQAGQTYTLRASVPGFETVESTLTMPTKPVIDDATFVVRSGGMLGGNTQGKARLTITLTDNPSTTDYYAAFVRLLDKQGKAIQASSIYTDFDDQDSDFEVGRFELSGDSYSFGTNLNPYADTNVSGKQFSLSANVSYYVGGCYSSPSRPVVCQELGYVEVRVSNMTPEAYRFYQSSHSYEETRDNPFAEPAPLASNVKPGYGLFGGAADATYRIKLF